MKRFTHFPKVTYQFVGLGFIILLWQMLSFTFGSFIVPQPLDTTIRIIELLGSGETYSHVLMTAWRVLTGFTVALAVALPWGMVAGRFSSVEAISKPIISLLRSVPVVSIIIIVLFFFGSRLMPSVISLLVVVPIIYTNTLTGMKNMDTKLIEMANIYGVSLKQRLYQLYFKGILPYLFAGLETGLGVAFKAVIAGEVISPPPMGIGASIWQTKLYLDLEGALAWTALALVLSFMLEMVIIGVREGAMPWKKTAS